MHLKARLSVGPGPEEEIVNYVSK